MVIKTCFAMIAMIQPFHLVLEGSLKSSPGMDPGAAFPRLERALDEVSRRHRRPLRTSLQLTTGTTFQALLREPPSFPALATALEIELPGFQLRFGLGWGPVLTPLRGSVHRMDGPAFQRAHVAHETARRAGLWAAVEGFPPPEKAVLEGLLQLLGAVRWRWKPRQRETIALARNHPTLKEVARLRGVTPPTVSRSLEGAMYRPTIAAERGLAAALELFTAALPA